MTLTEKWINEAVQLFTNSDFGFLASLIPLVLLIGISWAISRKIPDALIFQFPLALGLKLLFPFLHVSLVLTSFAIFIMAIIGSKNDVLVDVKNTPQKIRDTVMSRSDITEKALRQTKLNKLDDTFNTLMRKFK